MTPDFLAAVIDTLLPGDEVMPSGTAAGLDLHAIAAAHSQFLDMIASESFTQGDTEARVQALTSAEDGMPDAFRAFVAAILADYFETVPVLAALGWRSDPPQPHGYELPRFEKEVASLLAKAKLRPRSWRG